MRNYPEILAARFKKLFPKTAVYSNVDPAREWQGTTTIEFTETDATRERYISGASRRVVSLSAAIRAENQREAANVGVALKTLLICTLSDWSGGGYIRSYSIEDEGTTPDARGVVLGESFYWYIDFKIEEHKYN